MINYRTIIIVHILESIKFVKNGIASDYQQFRCNACKKNYTIRTNTIWQIHINQQKFEWNILGYFHKVYQFVRLLKKMDKKINLKTSFYWRHKILKVLTKKN